MTSSCTKPVGRPSNEGGPEMNRYLKFDLIERKPKTAVYLVRPFKGYEVLGRISSFSHWRHYVFSPLEGTVFDSACLGEVKEFIDALMMERGAPK